MLNTNAPSFTWWTVASNIILVPSIHGGIIAKQEIYIPFLNLPHVIAVRVQSDWLNITPSQKRFYPDLLISSDVE